MCVQNFIFAASCGYEVLFKGSKAASMAVGALVVVNGEIKLNQHTGISSKGRTRNC